MSKKNIIPEGYDVKLDFIQTQKAIKLVKDTLEKKLVEDLCLTRVSAPRFLITGTGLQDDLAGTQIPVSFKAKFSEKPIEMVHSLAKWKRHTLGKYGFERGTGILTDMDAVRKDEDLSEIHSIYVDQWDWEKVISPEQRTLDYLKETVQTIYESLLGTAVVLEHKYPVLKSERPQKIAIIHTEELEQKFPELTPKEREDAIAQEYSAVFLVGIGYPLKSGKPHDLRAADYDDWSTSTGQGNGLNGDIIVWDEVRKKSLELSSMGIRVDKEALLRQLDYCGLNERKGLEFHQAILEERMPLSIGGGIGESRVCMYLLQKAHIGEVQSSAWPEEVERECQEKGVVLL